MKKSIKKLKIVKIRSTVKGKKTASSKKQLFFLRHKPAIIKGLFIIAGMEFIASAIIYIAGIPSVRQTWVLATTVQPERFTELYFENHTNLPKEALPDKEYAFKFTIHNLEYKDTLYKYEVYIETGKEKRPIDAGDFLLKQDEFKTIETKYELEKEYSRSKVVVNLKNKKQEVFFWIAPSDKQVEISSK